MLNTSQCSPESLDFSGTYQSGWKHLRASSKEINFLYGLLLVYEISTFLFKFVKKSQFILEHCKSSHNVYNLQVHLAFITKYRYKVLIVQLIDVGLNYAVILSGTGVWTVIVNLDHNWWFESKGIMPLLFLIFLSK